jgi:enterochelin esterase-like enzyme
VTSISLVSGAVPAVLLVLGALSLVWLAWGRRRHVFLVVPLAAAVAVLLTLILYGLAEDVFYWWNASLPRILYIYAAFGILCLILVFPRIRAADSLWPRLVTVTAAALAVTAVAGAANSAYGQFPTVGSLFSPPQPEAEPLPERSPGSAAGLPATTDTNWTPPDSMPAGGKVYSATIPGAVSGYASNPALVYLPPAYLADPAAVNLPVLVLIHGQPGSPGDWLVGGQLLEMMDSFAADHAGLAPVVVMPDASNANNKNWPLCLDSEISSSATYLAVDVPAWVQQHLAAGLNGGSQFGIAGYSYGGTCALQLAANYPEAYPTFIDISGEAEPEIPQGRQALIDTYFNGDAAAFTKQNALDLLADGSYPDSAGIVVVGADDSVYAPQGEKVAAAARSAGMEITLQKVPGAHSWQVWKAGLAQNLDWLGRRLGILSS